MAQTCNPKSDESLRMKAFSCRRRQIHRKKHFLDTKEDKLTYRCLLCSVKFELYSQLANVTWRQVLWAFWSCSFKNRTPACSSLLEPLGYFSANGAEEDQALRRTRFEWWSDCPFGRRSFRSACSSASKCCSWSKDCPSSSPLDQRRPWVRLTRRKCRSLMPWCNVSWRSTMVDRRRLCWSDTRWLTAWWRSCIRFTICTCRSYCRWLTRMARAWRRLFKSPRRSGSEGRDWLVEGRPMCWPPTDGRQAINATKTKIAIKFNKTRQCRPDMRKTVILLSLQMQSWWQSRLFQSIGCADVAFLKINRLSTVKSAIREKHQLFEITHKVLKKKIIKNMCLDAHTPATKVVTEKEECENRNGQSSHR